MKTGGKHSERLADPDTLAAQVLGFLAEDPERLGDFLAVTGLDPQALRRAAATPGFTRGVLAYLAGDEGLLIAFADRIGAHPERLGLALARATREGHEFE